MGKSLDKILSDLGIRNQSLTEEDRDEKIAMATNAYAKFMDIIEPDWRCNPQSVGTPKRVAKMFINELMVGEYGELPNIAVFNNDEGYDGLVFQGDIEVKSMCSHHHMPFQGKAYIAYIPSKDGKIIGLSKLNRIVELCSRRMHVQESLTAQIANIVQELIGDNSGVAVHIEANHTCVSHRGIRQNSTMKTTKLTGYFFTNELGTRDEFFNNIKSAK